MSGDNVMIALVSHDCERAIGDATDVPEMLRRAFAAAKGHWMVLEQDPQLKGALNAVLKKMGEQHAEYQRLVTEIELLGKMAAWMNAAEAGVAGGVPTIPDGFEAFGVMKLWHETPRAAASARTETP